MESLKQAWFTHFPPSASSPTATKWWQLIDAAYAEPHRSYHSRTHVESLWRLFESIPNTHSPLVLLLAICFHDIIYDPKSSSNEAQSADVFTAFAVEVGEDVVKKDDVAMVTELILATISHKSNGSTICDFFLDLDLSILASDWELYKEYAKGIRKEYECYDDAAFRSGRSAVLEKFLARPNLYFTPELKEKWEEKARANITQEIKELNQ
ncbi:hypothetical protein BCR33DRAFT_767087 [Rhizoclosmatium globosum]|uniref:HD domain-containing protein n=1 Tax=Rhizoclosmatium globosum TaxID=329046 RepID=A0A1Y2C558_9FUNG|nr:hypothetical protein BCR33DRAFT_767087 [Rhizoclosmatium globosum]|eukprot:ORY42168.1 hypothetical protein BCR33DRAFT_767087 [Rhizoclosmatium globosum]